MANIKISNLPTYSGSAADLRWFVINNSGNTETFKYSGYTSGVKPVMGVNNSFMTINYTGNSISCKNSILIGGDDDNTIASTDATGRNTIVGGNGNSIPTGFGNGIFNGIGGASIQGNQCTMVGASGNITDGFGNVILGGVGNCGGNWSAIVGGYSNSIGGVVNDRCFIGGGGNNTIGNSPNSAIVAGYNNNLTSGAITFVAGTQDNTITAAGYTFSLVGGGYNTVQNNLGSGAAAGNAMYSSYFCIDNSKNDNSVIGNSTNWFSGVRGGNISGYGKHNWITNSYNATITNDASVDNNEWFNKIDSSSGATLVQSRQSQISCSIETNISGKTGAQMIGTSGRTALYDYTTHVENSYNYKTESFAVISGGTVGGNINVDCSLGTIFTFTITANTTPNFINLRDGQRLIFIVNNSGTFSVPTATVGGVSSTVYATGGTLNPTNNGYTKYTATYASGILWIDVELNFQAV